jgi:hypothetical protein
MPTTLSPTRAPLPPVSTRPRPSLKTARDAGRFGVAAALVTALGIAIWVALRQTVPPRVVADSAPATAFSAERAVRHLDIIAAEPRFVASRGHAATRAYLIEQITALGLAPVVQSTTSALRFPGASSFDAGSVHNVLTRIPGTNSTGAILLSAHYDGGATGPAAGDCGACVVTLLETLRALSAGPPLVNDVIFVFSDAEEVGDLGAHAFATQHRWMSDVRLALNFEAQGAAGPGMLYVTSAGNERLVSAFARAAPHATTSSFFVGLMSALPAMRGACDLQDYMDAGSAGLGFIFTGNASAYHTSLDNAQELDTRSVQHFGGYALDLVRHFGNRELTDLTGGVDAIFFNAWSGAVIHYPTTWALPLALVSVALLLGVLVLGARRGRIAWARTAVATLAFFVSVILGVATVSAVWWAIRSANPDLQVFMVGYHATSWYLAGLSFLSVACVMAMSLALRARITVAYQAVGAMAGFGALTLAVAVLFPLGSYVFLWPLVAGIPALGWMLVMPQARSRLVRRWIGAVAVILAILVDGVILVPVGLNATLGLLSRLEGTAGVPLLGVSTVFITLLAALLLPFLQYAVGRAGESGTRRGWWLLMGGAAAVWLVAIGVGMARSGFDVAHPRPDQIRYELDADRSQARWVTSDNRLDEWTTQFIPASTTRNAAVKRGFPNGPATFATAAPVLPLPGPQVVVLDDLLLSDLRLLRLRIVSPRGAPMLEVRIDASEPIVRASVAGRVLDVAGYEPAARGNLAFTYAAPPGEGVEVVLRTNPAGDVRIKLADMSSGLPDIPGWRTPTRPATTMPAPGGTADGIIVRRAFDLPVRHGPYDDLAHNYQSP